VEDIMVVLGAIVSAPSPRGEAGSSLLVDMDMSSQHAIMSASMTNARRARMRVEADRQLLANRIARLQAEEVRSMKRIEETLRKAQEMLAVKSRHQLSELEKEASRLGHEDAIDKHKQELLQMKEQHRIAIIAAKQSQTLTKAEQAREAKRANEENAIAIARARGAEYSAAALRRNAVRQDQEAARERRHKEKELLLEHLQERSAAREMNEARRAREYADELARMQEEERRLLESLHQSHEERKQAFREVEEKAGDAKPVRLLLQQVLGFAPPKAHTARVPGGRLIVGSTTRAHGPAALGPADRCMARPP
jgi:hypothetical protein